MNNHITFYFCGTGRVHTRSKYVGKKKLDTCSGYIFDQVNKIRLKSSINRSTLGPVITIDGCDIGKWNNFGLTAHGTGERAKEALKYIRAYVQSLPRGEILKINAIGHSRGCISALKLVEYIARERDNLSNKVSIVLDLKDAVPGDLNWSSNIGTSVAKRVSDMSSYTFVRKAYMTFTDQNGRTSVNSTGFQPIMPKFSEATTVEVDSIIGNHGAFAEKYKEYPGAYELINANTIELILEHAGVNDPEIFDTLKKTQLSAYKEMLAKKVRHRYSHVTDRVFHYGGKLSSTGYKKPASLNTKHRKLQKSCGVKIENEQVALELFAPEYYSYFESLSLLSDGESWASPICDVVDNMAGATFLKTLQAVFRDSSYYPKLGNPKDTLTPDIARNILAALTRENLYNPRYQVSTLQSYANNIERCLRKISIRSHGIINEAGGRDKVFFKEKKGR